MLSEFHGVSENEVYNITWLSRRVSDQCRTKFGFEEAEAGHHAPRPCVDSDLVVRNGDYRLTSDYITMVVHPQLGSVPSQSYRRQSPLVL